jgi:eukaryotic-like serine/threonine-protein kinase
MNNLGKLAENIGILVQGGTVNISRFFFNLFTINNYGSEDSGQERINRQRLLENVRIAWIEGVLESSLHEQVLITLGLEERPQAVDRPWSLQIKEPDQPSRFLPEGTSIITPFDQLGTGGTLLILGEPGSGKTLTLLELARDLIKRAEEEADQPIPVVLNLSSWALQKRSLSVWVVEEINAKYTVPKKIGEEWVKGQKLLLLLDGLDEIRDLSARDECVTALNAFQLEQETAMVVCCRVKEHEWLGKRLEAKSALVIQPLSSEQIRTYLDQLLMDLTGLKALLERDYALQELAQSPLMLNIMVLTYLGIEIEEGLVETVTAKERMQQLFDDYINRMFTRPREFAYARNSRSQEKESYSGQQATRWLIWLARQMRQRSQTIFLIEKLQPDWLVSGNIKLLYKALAFLNSGLIFGLLYGLIGTPILGLSHGVGLINELNIWISSVLTSGLFGGLIGGLIGVLFGLTKLFEDIKTIEAVKWSWKNPRRNMLYWGRGGLTFGLTFGTLGGLAIWISNRNSLLVGLLGGLITVVVFGLLGVLLGGLIGGPVVTEIENKNQPNQGIWVSAKNAIILGPIFGLLIFGLLFVIALGLNGEPSNILLVGLLIGLGVGFINGGLAFLQHFTLRFLLYRNNCMPWKLVPFLQFCTERLFLYRVGGGYVFVHRLLMEHFAQMEE